MRKHQYHMYIMASRSRVLYTGVSGNLEQRVLQHKHKVQPGFTSRYRVSRLVYYEEYGDIREAISREKQLKAWRRSKKVALIESMNPQWRDLSKEWDA